VFPKRRFQHGAVPEESLHRRMPFVEADYRRQFLSLYQ
jgi:asparagine synthase (glutamine-hydrolysing)